ncbi:helix-turn-helix domain-containing protein [Ovoidimarina sediminis]|uniref:helix-turn-helix domain-containing protein n=1 Tax=Ovoidimarina sediminis TaxID=3079856 RepID=UPI00292D2FB4|nr:helix-turn-helix transcriptional regulator [Rhodophyticola sp. MJ-SS7]
MNEDDYIGRRMRHRRWEQGMSQTELADSVLIEPHDIQLFESGVRSVPRLLLIKIAAVQDVPVSYYTDGIEDAPAE